MSRAELSPLERVGLRAAGLVLACMAATIARVPNASVDGRTLWGFHARLIHDTGRYPAPDLFDPGFRIPHAQYPPLLPLLQAASLRLLPGEPTLRVVPWLFFLGVAALLWRELPRRDQRRGRLLALCYVLLPTLVLSEEGGADAGVADTAFAAFILGAALLLDSGRPALAGLLALAAALTKNEGLVLGPLLLASSYWRCGSRRREWSPALLGLAVFTAGILPWLWLRQSIPSGFDELYASRLNLEQFSRGLYRGPGIVAEMLRIGFLHPQRSGHFWWMVVLLALCAPRRRELLTQGRLLVVPAYFALVFVLYLVSPWSGVTQVQLSFERLLVEVAPLALLALASQGVGTGSHSE